MARLGTLVCMQEKTEGPSNGIAASLARHAERIRQEGPDASPFIITEGDVPYVVLLPYEMFIRLLDATEDAEIYASLLAREMCDNGERYTLEEAATQLGIDINDLRDEGDSPTS